MGGRRARRRRSIVTAGTSRDEGATLIAVVVLVAILALFASAILSYVSQSYQAAAFSRDRTQALYNARMGIDAAISLVERDAGALDLKSGTAYTQLQTAVNSDLKQLGAPPFTDVVTVGPPVAGVFPVIMRATGVSGRGVVTLTEPGGIQAAGPGTGSGGGNVASVSIASSLQDVHDLSVSQPGAPPISLTGTGSGSIVVNGAAASVTGFGHGDSHNQLTVISAVYAGVRLREGAAAVWIQGGGDTVKGSSPHVAVVTGANDTVILNELHLLVATGQNATINAATGTALLLGANDTQNGSVTCGALVTGNGAVLTGPKINGPLVITGNDVVVGSPQQPVSINGEVALIGNGITVYGDVSNPSGTAVLAIGQNEAIHGSKPSKTAVRGNITDYNNNLTVTGAVRGSTVQFPGGQSVVIGGNKQDGTDGQGQCLGTVTVNFAAANSAPRMTLNFAGATIGG